jgi:hypothetical protein
MKRLAIAILAGLALAGLASLLWLAPMPQPLWYHDFADKRSLLGIANFWNVLSNLPFLLVGGWGICYLASAQSAESVQDTAERWMYVFFFAAVALTGVGSAYYHLEPNNHRLVWDRLPIALTFMALFAIIITERLSRSAGILLFFPLVMLGALSVVYWHLSETWGKGDLRLYLLTQLYPILAIPVVVWLCPGRYTGEPSLYSALAWYAGAKLYEFLDRAVFSAGQIISGHTLKHIGAAAGCYVILRWLCRRRLVSGNHAGK